MNKVFILAPNENWIVDRLDREWYEDNADISVDDPREAQIIWLHADWCFDQLPYELLQQKRVITTIHHIVPEKFDAAAQREFHRRDAITNVYHVMNVHTLNFIRPLTSKPIELIPYWANNRLWKRTDDKLKLRAKHDLPLEAYLIGSFQRDTEGAGISKGVYLPKLEKGPDILADYVTWLNDQRSFDDLSRVHVVLAGWRRQYIISRLEQAKVPYSYFEMPDLEVINELYQCLDLYPVTARAEGGPQSLIECGLVGVPCISRDIGVASQVLPVTAVNNDLMLAVPSVPNVDHMRIPKAYELYRKLIESL